MAANVAAKEYDRVARLLQGALDLLDGLPPAGPASASRERVNALVGAVSGTANPFAPPLELTHFDDRVEGRCMLSRLHEGSAGFAHGGVSALLLDEICAHVPEARATERVTTSARLRYRRPVPVEEPLLLVARGRKHASGITVEAFIATKTSPDVPLVTAEAELVYLRPEQIERLALSRREASGRP